MTDFREILNMKGSDIKRLPPLPEGIYRGAFVKAEIREVETKNGKAAVAEYPVRLLEMLDGDDTELRNAGGLKETSRTRYSFWLTEIGLPDLKDAVKAVGEDPDTMSVGEMLAALEGKQARFRCEHDVDKRNEEIRYLRAVKMFAL